VTLKKFGYMVCQGVKSTKADFVTLQSLIQPQQIPLLKQGLDLLEQLNVADILKNYQGQQYYLLAQQDALVSCKVIDNLQNLNAKFLDVDLISGSHGFPVFHAAETSDKIFQYLKKIKQTS
jgi:pimeloyl-[acyl-carrier protein] methyl ester esterase